jgi:hypothetical protein
VATMRSGLVLLASSLALTPSLALASPFARMHAMQAPAPTSGTTSTTSTTSTPTTGTTTTTTTTTTDPSLRPTSSKAPPSTELPEEPKPEEPPKVEPPPAEPVTPPPPPVEPEKWNRHGIGIRSGITVLPTFAVRKYVQSLTNALCRGDSIPSGALGDKLTRVGGCNFYIGLEYIYRQSKNLDIVPAVTYHQLKAPDGLWLDDSEFTVQPNGTKTPNLGAADFTQVNFSHLALQVDFIGRANLIKTADFAWQLGGGGGIGLGIIVGKGFLQTPLGNPPGSPSGNTCQSIDDFSDFTRCTPHYQDMEANGVPPPAEGSLKLDAEGDNPFRFAKCTAGSCNGADLDALGRKKGIDLPVIPIVNLLVTTRFIIKDTFGINITGGWQTGFYFGGSLQYFFGPK